MQRPSKMDLDIVERVSREVSVEIKEWSLKFGDQEFLPEIFEILYNNINPYEDGYSLSRRIESATFYEPDIDLVNILNKVSDKFKKYHYDKLIEWIKNNNLKPEFSIGDKVHVNLRGKSTIDGEIVLINSEIGLYKICCEKLGHIKDGKCGLLIPFEDTYREIKEFKEDDENNSNDIINTDTNSDKVGEKNEEDGNKVIEPVNKEKRVEKQKRKSRLKKSDMDGEKNEEK